MCDNSYYKILDSTGKIMIFCTRLGSEASLSNLCVSQRYCKDKDRYIEGNQKQSCKYYSEKQISVD